MRKDWVGPVISGCVSAFVSWALKEFSWAEMSNHLYSFLVTFSPLLIGFTVAGIYWAVRDYIRLRRWVYWKTPHDTNIYPSLEAKLRKIAAETPKLI